MTIPWRLLVVAASAAGLASPALAQAPARVLPEVKPLHLALVAPAADVPAPCRKFAGAFAGQFSNGPYANLVITDVTIGGPHGCVFRGTYAWSAYQSNPDGTTPIGPGTYLDGEMNGADLKLGDLSNMGMVVHADLRADFYMQGSLVSRAAFARLTPQQLN
jgi:hypothetical protein